MQLLRQLLRESPKGDQGRRPGHRLFEKRRSYIKQPSKMVFFGDQDARAVGSSGDSWEPLHSSPKAPLMANMTFVDGSMRLVDVIKGYEDKEYIFYNEQRALPSPHSCYATH